jgi:predicted SprT family Zn-dependent metalloprotease
MVKMFSNIQDNRDEQAINHELAYLLHVRRKGHEYKRDAKYSSLDKQLKELMHSYHAVDYNPRVLVVLIESGHCQRML